MKKITWAFLMLLGCSISGSLRAQEERSDNRYLAGAVPEVEGKVVFSRKFQVPHMSKEEIYRRMNAWMEDRLKANKNNSRIVYRDEAQTQIIGMGDEWLVFSSTALSLDRTRILYQLSATCDTGSCKLDVNKITYLYREGKERYVAEEWIADKYALNKTKTKLVRGLAKWRRKTVDFIDGLYAGATEALSRNENENEATEQQKKTETTVNATQSSAPIVIKPNNKVEVTVPSHKAQTASPVLSEANGGYKEIAPELLPSNLIGMGMGRLVVVIGNDMFNRTTLTANVGGSIGQMLGKPVVFTLLSPEQPYSTLEAAETYSVHFYPTGEASPSVILECKKMPSQAPLEGQPRMYVGEIVKAQVK